MYIFSVVVKDTDGARKCRLLIGYSLKYNLNIAQSEIILEEVRDGGLVKALAWDYRNIRRYGHTESTFSLEAGRSSESGEGHFKFSVPDGKAVFNEVNISIRMAKSAALSQFPDSSNLAPPLPPRSNLRRLNSYPEKGSHGHERQARVTSEPSYQTLQPRSKRMSEYQALPTEQASLDGDQGPQRLDEYRHPMTSISASLQQQSPISSEYIHPRRSHRSSHSNAQHDSSETRRELSSEYIHPSRSQRSSHPNAQHDSSESGRELSSEYIHPKMSITEQSDYLTPMEFTESDSTNA